MAISQVSSFSTAWRTLDKAFLDQIRLIDFLDRTWIFSQGCGDGSQSDRTTCKLVNDDTKELVVNVVQAIAVDI